MLTILEETTSEHVQSINNGLYQLVDKNISWILILAMMEMEQYTSIKKRSL